VGTPDSALLPFCGGEETRPDLSSARLMHPATRSRSQLEAIAGPKIARVTRERRPEAALVERPPNGPPEELSADDRNRLDLVQPHALPALRHLATLQNGRRPLEAAFGKSSGVAIAWEVCLHRAPFSNERAHRAHFLHRITGI